MGNNEGSYKTPYRSQHVVRSSSRLPPAPSKPLGWNIKKLALTERSAVEAKCLRCRAPFKRLRQERERERRVQRYCDRCLWIKKRQATERIERGEAKRERKDKPSGPQGPWPVRCLRCSWTGVVRNKFSAWVCGANPTHPVVVDGQK